jgi:hypothetical protein
MAQVMADAFPGVIKPEEVLCTKVTRSSCVEGFTLVTWSGPLERKEYPGWSARDAKYMDYNYA